MTVARFPFSTFLYVGIYIIYIRTVHYTVLFYLFEGLYSIIHME